MNYTNHARPLVVNTNIVEYDIAHGNTSIMREFDLASPKIITKLEAMTNTNRWHTVGNMGRKSKAFSKALEKGFNDVVKEFIKQNDLDLVMHVLSVKRDAVFVVNRGVLNEHVREYVWFRPKNQYENFIRLGQYEFFQKASGDFDVKGIKDDLISLHADGILTFVNAILHWAREIPKGKYKAYVLWVKEFMSAYKRRELPFDYYREFNPRSKFRYLTQNGEEVWFSQLDEEIFEGIDISYNLINILIPAIRIIESP